MAVSAWIDLDGIHLPSYAEVLEDLRGVYRGIYGQDIYIEDDSQDGQLIAAFALRLYDCYTLAASVYHSYSPASAQGAGLSSVVKTNGIRRRVASYSTADLVIGGQAGAELRNAKAKDTAGRKWLLPANVVIPPAGEITVTATAEDIGDIRASAGEINGIATPIRGWQTVTNPAAAVPGAPVESDAQLRRRQTLSTAIPAVTVFDSTVGAVADLAGVTRYRGYENDTHLTSAIGLPPHSIALVVEGGDNQAIAEAIARKKTPGTGTHGTTTVQVVDRYGLWTDIKFSRPTVATIGVEIDITPLSGYTSGFADDIAAAVAAHINALEIGSTMLITKLYVPANLAGSASGSTFDISEIRIGKDGGTTASANIPLAFDEIPYCDPAADVTINLL